MVDLLVVVVRGFPDLALAPADLVSIRRGGSDDQELLKTTIAIAQEELREVDGGWKLTLK
jgi:hypothetical protein